MDTVRILSRTTAVIALAVAVNAFGVGAPGLGLVAVPFVAAVLTLRRSPRVGAVIAILGCLLVAVTAALYLANGFGLQSGFDALYVFVAGPLALVGIAAAVGVLRPQRVLRG